MSIQTAQTKAEGETIVRMRARKLVQSCAGAQGLMQTNMADSETQKPLFLKHVIKTCYLLYQLIFGNCLKSLDRERGKICNALFSALKSEIKTN